MSEPTEAELAEAAWKLGWQAGRKSAYASASRGMETALEVIDQLAPDPADPADHDDPHYVAGYIGAITQMRETLLRQIARAHQ